MRLFLSVAVFLFTAFAAVPAFAQSKSQAKDKDAGNKLISNVKLTVGAERSLQLTYEGHSADVSSADAKTDRDWMSVFVSYDLAMRAGKTGKTAWLDDVEVVLLLLMPSYDEQGRTDLAVFRCQTVLEPLMLDGKQHRLRFMIPPAALLRYAPLLYADNSKNRPYRLPKKLNESLSACVFFKVRGQLVDFGVIGLPSDTKTGAKGSAFDKVIKSRSVFQGKLNFDALRSTDAAASHYEVGKMFSIIESNPRSFVLRELVIPADKTMFAWVDYDKLDHIKPETGGK